MTVPLCQWRQRKNYHTIWYHSQFLLTNMNIYTRDYGDSHEEITYCLRKRQTRFFTCSFEKWLPCRERIVKLSHCIYLLWINSCKNGWRITKLNDISPNQRTPTCLLPLIVVSAYLLPVQTWLVVVVYVHPVINHIKGIYFKDFNAIIVISPSQYCWIINLEIFNNELTYQFHDIWKSLSNGTAKTPTSGVHSSRHRRQNICKKRH